MSRNIFTDRKKNLSREVIGIGTFSVNGVKVTLPAIRVNCRGVTLRNPDGSLIVVNRNDVLIERDPNLPCIDYDNKMNWDSCKNKQNPLSGVAFSCGFKGAESLCPFRSFGGVRNE